MSVKFKSAAIIGCGWFGLPLAKALLSIGVEVTATRRSNEGVLTLNQNGIVGVELDLSSPIIGADRVAEQLKADVLVISIPPGLRYGNRDYVAQLTRLLALIEGHVYQRVVFISTTGVYPNQDKNFDETSACEHSPSATILLQAEALFSKVENATICRFAGLVGPKRHPGRFFGGKTDISGANASVNLVHLEDCIGAVIKVLTSKKASHVYNVCAPIHPGKQAFYTAAASDLGVALPEFNDTCVPDKRINGNKLIVELDFEYRYSDPQSMLTEC